jgi:hypothetical protein
MFETAVYVRRRKLLKKRLGKGLLLFLGNEESPMNYPSNTYPFRQDSSFLYFFGLDAPGLAGVIDVDSGTDMIFGDDITLEDVIWMGELPAIKERAAAVGITRTAPLARLDDLIAQARKKGRPIHFLPPYRPETLARLSELLILRPQVTKQRASAELIRTVVDQRSTKSEEEIAEIENPWRSAVRCTPSPWRWSGPASTSARSSEPSKVSPGLTASGRPSRRSCR